MKSLSKLDVRNRMSFYVPSETYDIHDQENYDKMFMFSIPGTPISDSRPRYIKALNTFYNPNKEQQMKIFREINRVDKHFRSQYIYTPTVMVIDYYMVPPKNMNQEDLKLAREDKVIPLFVKDNDNIEKVVYDCIQEFILFDDKLIYSNVTNKHYCSTKQEERIDVKMLYSSNFPNRYHLDVVMRSKVFKDQILGEYVLQKKVEMFDIRNHVKFVFKYAPLLKLKMDDFKTFFTNMDNNQRLETLRMFNLKAVGSSEVLIKRLMKYMSTYDMVSNIWGK